MSDPKLVFLKFDSAVCGPCIAMNKKGLLKELARTHRNLTLVDLVILDEDGEAPTGTSFVDAWDLSDDFEVESTPTVVVLTEAGVEVARRAGPLMRSTELTKLYDTAVKNAQRLALSSRNSQKVRAFVKAWGSAS
ncbi:MAG: hypothetical protein AMXMBFR34_11000 [Myxococcaceae bacterium]